MLTEHKSNAAHYFRDDEGRLQGYYLRYDLAGKLVEHAHYIDNHHHGEFKRWWGNGQLGVKGFYYNGGRHGESKSWWENGTLSKHAFYLHDEDITDEIIASMGELQNHTLSDRLVIRLKYGFSMI